MSEPPALQGTLSGQPSPPAAAVPVAEHRAGDDDRIWLTPLAAAGAAHDQAVRELHRLLLRASTFEVRRRAAALALAVGPDLDDIALQAADDALLAVLARLDRFERRSRFTTWAYKFAIHTAGVAVRRHAWRDREPAAGSEGTLEELADRAQSPSETAETRELLGRITRAVPLLTPHQRDVLLALAVEGVPIDVLAERLSTNRNALYKTLHDARARLRVLLDLQEITS